MSESCAETGPNRNHAACGEPSQPKFTNERPNVHSQQVGAATSSKHVNPTQHAFEKQSCKSKRLLKF